VGIIPISALSCTLLFRRRRSAIPRYRAGGGGEERAPGADLSCKLCYSRILRSFGHDGLPAEVPRRSPGKVPGGAAAGHPEAPAGEPGARPDPSSGSPVSARGFAPNPSIGATPKGPPDPTDGEIRKAGTKGKQERILWGPRLPAFLNSCFPHDATGAIDRPLSLWGADDHP